MPNISAPPAGMHTSIFTDTDTDPCPKCGLPMSISGILLSGPTGTQETTFNCAACGIEEKRLTPRG